MKILQYVVGPVQTNCYFLINENTKETLIVDPGDAAEALADEVRTNNLSPAAILLTHGHFDHAGAAKALSERFQIPVYALAEERETLHDPVRNRSAFMGRTTTSYDADVWLHDGQELTLGGLTFRVLHTPGHTPGGCCYYLASEEGLDFAASAKDAPAPTSPDVSKDPDAPAVPVLLSGDTLFCRSVGRTDFPDGSMQALVQGIRDKLMVLPPETQVLPGHGELTTIGEEMRENPFLHTRS